MIKSTIKIKNRTATCLIAGVIYRYNYETGFGDRETREKSRGFETDTIAVPGETGHPVRHLLFRVFRVFRGSPPPDLRPRFFRACYPELI